MNDATKEIEQLFPQGKPVTLKGKEYIVKPFGFGKFPKVLKLMNSVNTGSAVANVADLPKMDLGAFIVDNSDVVVDLCVLAISEKKEWFDDLPGDEGIKLCQAIVEVNADFFMTRLQPQLLEALSGLTSSVGALSSQISLQPATA